MKTTRKKSFADISAQFNRLIKEVSGPRYITITKAEQEYRYRIMDRFGCAYGISDRARYTPVTRKSYAGY